MGVIETHSWLEEDAHAPEEMLMKKGLTKRKAAELYGYLKMFGMYSPSANTKKQTASLIKREAWKKMDILYKKYRTLWKGPSVPIYIFPVQESRGFFSNGFKKSGVSFRDEIYLFISDDEDAKEWEALFLHEYHHCTRMNLLEKDPEQYTLLDSIIFEGLAEDAVKEYCGNQYVSDWTKKYSGYLLEKLWNQHFKNQLHLKRQEARHDQLLLGRGRYPALLGYAMGYYIVEKYRKKYGTAAKEMMTLDAAVFIEDEQETES
ncbi:hypothetical protein D3H55_07680 [Bacillus salacetis]|uniref:DUF2268 domain-containing protein n=1 Tax=Bacillus salacetis TaxID=2315464 RepID=A0A3A1R6Y5_9BACI|nr:DUF2268 domain-containing putative Zn-dependent protease [Bacillus salacetis]RIW35271.1 hypothetical protein D3H55_07680 [Bacillus salacetis]